MVSRMLDLKDGFARGLVEDIVRKRIRVLVEWLETMVHFS